jgi:prevent-host-death family protein
MKVVPVHQLKARLSAYLAVVRAGGELIVTDRSKPVARISPVTAADDWEAHLQELVARGLVRLPNEPLQDEFFDGLRVKDPEGKVLRALLEERGIKKNEVEVPRRTGPDHEPTKGKRQ